MQNARLEIALDGVGTLGGQPQAMVYGPETLSAATRRALNPSWTVERRPVERAGGDSGAFTASGVPAIWLSHWPEDERYAVFHTQLDDLDAIDWEHIRQGIEATYALIKAQVWA